LQRARGPYTRAARELGRFWRGGHKGPTKRQVLQRDGGGATQRDICVETFRASGVRVRGTDTLRRGHRLPARPEEILRRRGVPRNGHAVLPGQVVPRTWPSTVAEEPIHINQAGSFAMVKRHTMVEPRLRQQLPR